MQNLQENPGLHQQSVLQSSQKNHSLSNVHNSQQKNQKIHRFQDEKQQIKQQNVEKKQNLEVSSAEKNIECENQVQKRERPWQQSHHHTTNKVRKQFCDGSIVFLTDPQYQLHKLIGSGIYGIVASGRNTLTNQPVAVKKISKLFNNYGDTRRVLRQIKVLQFLNHDNIISLQDIMTIDDPDNFNEIYLCMEYMEFDLRRLIQSQVPIDQKMIKFIMYQLLSAISFMHSADILHRDLKPENILMNKKCFLKLADMNLARKEVYTGNITDYVASRPYRAPQILIGSTVYTKSVDIWSIGCIFAQLLGKTIIFHGKDFIDQLKRFVAILGKPKIEYFPNIDQTSMESLSKLIAQIPDKQKVDWKYLMPNITDKAADLLDHMLTYNANARYTAEECLNHPYLEMFKKAPRKKCEEIFDFSFDKIQLTESTLRKAIFESVLQFKAKKAKKLQSSNSMSEQDKIKKKIKEE